MALQESKLGHKTGGLILRCGGTVQQPRVFGRHGRSTPCKQILLVPEERPKDFETLNAFVLEKQWGLAVASLNGGDATIVDGELHVEQSAFDPLCEKCAAALLARLTREA